jgi:hypothetical protein
MMKAKIPTLTALLLAACLASGCVHFRQPKEFKNRKMKQDPPLLNRLPGAPLPLALKAASALTERI